MRFSFMLIAILVGAYCCLQAAEPEFKLPPNGSWAKYREVGWDVSGNESTDTMMVRLLAGPTEDGEKSRWIEFEREQPTNGNPSVEKYLVSETTLLRCDAPLRDAVRLWYKEGDNPPQRLDRVNNTRVFEMRNVVLNRYLVFLPKTRQSWKPLSEHRVVEYQQGKLDCPIAVVGLLVAGYDSRPATARFDVTDDCTIWLHTEIPFAVARGQGSRALVEVKDGVRSKSIPHGKFEFEIVDWGDGAKSALPDSQ